jgi:leucyl aminopeptidase
MNTQISREAWNAIDADVVIVPVCENERPALLDGYAAWLDFLRESKEFTGKSGEVAVLYQPAGCKAARLVVYGAGKRESFDVRKVTGGALRALKKSSKRIALLLEDASAQSVAAAVQGAVLGDFEPDHHKSSSDAPKADSFTLLVTGHAADLDTAFEQGRVIADAQNFTRELVNRPGNKLNPGVLADEARKTAAELGLAIDVLDQDRMRQLGMGSLLGVAQGSTEPPYLIVLSYQPATPKGTDHLALIGKGVTFDSGGISIKPADGMEKMKYDMAGAAAVLGAMRALAQLKPAIPVTAFIPTVENMVSGKAQRPGDIVTSMNGKTVEVLNTDAEGRLILIDAITYAIRQGATHLVDAATLTGAIVVALGHVHIGGFSNDEGFFGKLNAAAAAAGESVWRMPLDDNYKEQLKSPFADLANIGTRWGGAITAAYFIREFVENKPWVHLDIAGTAWLEENKPWMPKGPTGVCVRTFVDLAMNW